LSAKNEDGNLIRGVEEFSKGADKISTHRLCNRVHGSDLEPKHHFSIPPWESVEEYFLKNF
jgi:hypothetical protein